MRLIILSCLILALVFAGMAAFNKPSRFNLVGAALAFYFLSLVLSALSAI